MYICEDNFSKDMLIYRMQIIDTVLTTKTVSYFSQDKWDNVHVFFRKDKLEEAPLFNYAAKKFESFNQKHYKKLADCVKEINQIYADKLLKFESK